VSDVSRAMLNTALCIILLLLVPGLWGQESPTSQATLVFASGTPVKLQLAETISSAHARKNDPLEFVVVEDVTVKGLTLIRAGAEAQGCGLRRLSSKASAAQPVLYKPRRKFYR
jgi:hypothetical protein